MIQDYLHIYKLTPYILNKLVKRIEVGYTETVVGKSSKNSLLPGNFAGRFNEYP